MSLRLRPIEPDEPLHEQELALRYEVLRRPLGYPPGSERSPKEAGNLHLVALEESDDAGTEPTRDRVVGCVLFEPDGAEEGFLRQMAVHPDRAGEGLGRALVEELERRLRARGVRRIRLNARSHVVGFYERLGYRVESEPFVKLGVPHRRMSRTL